MTEILYNPMNNFEFLERERFCVLQKSKFDESFPKRTFRKAINLRRDQIFPLAAVGDRNRE